MTYPLNQYRNTVAAAVRVEEAVERIASGADLEVEAVRTELAHRAVLSSRPLNDVIARLMLDVADGTWPA